MWTILIIALVQMPTLALSPAINLIQTLAFPDKTLAQVQTVMGLTNLASPIASIVAMLLINKGTISKKKAVVTGLLLLFFTGLFAAIFHTRFEHLYVISILLGLSTGCFMSNTFGLMFDNYDNHDRQIITGFQTAAINGGGIILSLLGGVLATAMWFGGYLLFLIGLPIAILALFTVPNYKSPKVKIDGSAKGNSKLNPRVYYYAAMACVFMMIYIVCGSNISTHLSEIGTPATSGIAMGLQMGGGAITGMFFGRLSAKFKDMIMVMACLAVFIGFMILSIFSTSLIMIFIGVFISGMSLSLMLPHCTYRVSTLVDSSTSATATVIATSIAPSLGGFLSPVIFTNLTSAIVKDSTVFRYAFVGFVALAFGIVIFIFTVNNNKKKNMPLQKA